MARGYADILAVGAAAVAAPFLLPLLPAGSAIRILFAIVALAALPGYLLMLALEPVQERRWWHAAAAFGFGPPLVGLAALSTALAPGGFRADTIAVAIAAMCLLLAVVAFGRRFEATRRERPAPTDGTVGSAPTAFILLPPQGGAAAAPPARSHDSAHPPAPVLPASTGATAPSARGPASLQDTTPSSNDAPVRPGPAFTTEPGLHGSLPASSDADGARVQASSLPD